jgi:serine/threonine-protein kinase RsbW
VFRAIRILSPPPVLIVGEPDPDFAPAMARDACFTESSPPLYAYVDRGEHEIRIILERDGAELRATVEDDGRPFNPLEKEPPAVPSSLEDAGVGGWGIPIVRAFADDLSYERRGGRNRFTIISRERPSSS